MSRRGVAPVVGITLMVAVVVMLAAVVGAFAVGVGGQTEDVQQAAITADMEGNLITLTHEGGDDLTVDELTVRIFIDGQPLEHQPEVPSYGSKGFSRFRGEFSAFGSGVWEVGETAGLEIASTTNSPQPSAGSQVTVKIYSDGEAVATARV